MGLVAYESQTDAFVCEALRSQLGAAIKLSALHARVVSETAIRGHGLLAGLSAPAPTDAC